MSLSTLTMSIFLSWNSHKRQKCQLGLIVLPPRCITVLYPNLDVRYSLTSPENRRALPFVLGLVHSIDKAPLNAWLELNVYKIGFAQFEETLQVTVVFVLCKYFCSCLISTLRYVKSCKVLTMAASRLHSGEPKIP